MKVKVKLLDLSTMQKFYKPFGCEFDCDKFLRNLKYSKKIMKIGDVEYE